MIAPPSYLKWHVPDVDQVASNVSKGAALVLGWDQGIKKLVLDL
jgi:hypothetical protein